MIVRKLFILCSIALILWIIKGAFVSKHAEESPQKNLIVKEEPIRHVASASVPEYSSVNAISAEANSESMDHQERIEALMSCAKAPLECPFNFENIELHEQVYNIGSEILDEFSLYKTELDSGKKDIAKASELIRSMLQYPDERVKLEALKFTNEKNLDFDSLLNNLLDQLEDAVDPQLIAEALQGLQKYINTPYEVEILNFVEQVLMHGSYQASRQMAEMAYMLMSEGNRARFESMAQELPPNSLKRELLETSLHKAFP